jgi:secreted Zn-dependent insulinase-like peptidase
LALAFVAQSSERSALEVAEMTDDFLYEDGRCTIGDDALTKLKESMSLQLTTPPTTSAAENAALSQEILTDRRAFDRRTQMAESLARVNSRIFSRFCTEHLFLNGGGGEDAVVVDPRRVLTIRVEALLHK